MKLYLTYIRKNIIPFFRFLKNRIIAQYIIFNRFNSVYSEFIFNANRS